MATKILFLRGTTTANMLYTGVAGEITVDTTLNTLRLHDGITAGGLPLPSADALDDKVDTSSLGVADGVATLNEEGVHPATQIPFADNTAALAGTSEELVMSPARTKEFVEDGDYTIDLGVLPT